MKIAGIRTIIGQNTIDSAINQFNETAIKLAEGVSYCEADIKLHNEIIEDNKKRIEALESHIVRAKTVAERLNRLTTTENI